MKKFILPAILMCASTVFLVGSAFAQPQAPPETEKLAQTGMKFLSVSLDARAAGMADAQTAEDRASALAMFYNPASMARLNHNLDLAVGQTQWIVDINYNYASLALRPAEGKYGVFGLSLLSVDYGDLTETIRADNPSGYEDIGTFSPTALAVGLGYAIALSDRFSIGGNAKYVRESFGDNPLRLSESGSVVRQENTQDNIAFDFGVLYRTGFKSLNFAMTARNFATELTYAEESFELPLTFRIGISMDLLDFTQADKSKHSLLLSVDTERPRDFNENVKIGAEYTFQNLISLRGGYAFPQDEQGVSLGAGLQQDWGNVRFSIDYSYTDFGIFSNVNRFSFRFAF